LSFYFPPDYCAGSFRANGLKNAFLRRKDLDTLLILTTYPQRYGHIKNVSLIEKTNNLIIRRVKTPEHNNKFYRQIYNFFVYSIFCFSYALKNRKSFDCIFITSSRFGTAFLGYLLSMLLNKPFYSDIRDIFSDSLNSISKLNNYFGKIIKGIVKKLEIVVLSRAKWVNFVSPGFVNYFKEIPNAKITIHTNGIDDIFIKNYSNTLKNKPKNNQLPLKLIYTGNIGYGQGLEKITLPIAKHFKDKIEFNIIGDGSALDLLLKCIQEDSIDNINIIPPMDRTHLIKYYNEADVLFLHLNDIPAFKRVLPSKIFEYSTFNKPILAGVAGASKTFLMENLKGANIFSPGEYRSAITLIEKFINNRSEESGIDNTVFIKKYDRKLISDRMVSHFFKICKGETN